MDRVLACLIGIAVAVLPVAAEAKGGAGGGHCSTGAGHSSSHHGKGSSTAFRGTTFSTFFLFGAGGYYAARAGYVRPDGTYVEPAREETPAEPQPEFRNDCPPDMDCRPPGGPSAG